MDDFMSKEFRLQQTDFKVQTFPALTGWRVLESIRAEIGRAVDADLLKIGQDAVNDHRSSGGVDVSKTPDSESERAQIAAFVRLLLGLSEPFVEGLRKRMSEVIFFKNRVAQDWLPVQGNEDTAFMDLTPLHVYEVLGRALAVNFFGSFRDLLGPISFGRQSSRQ